MHRLRGLLLCILRQATIRQFQNAQAVLIAWPATMQQSAWQARREGNAVLTCVLHCPDAAHPAFCHGCACRDKHITFMNHAVGNMLLQDVNPCALCDSRDTRCTKHAQWLPLNLKF